METNIKDLTVDVANSGRITGRVTAMQGDNQSRYLRITILNNGQSVNLSNLYPVLRGTKADGKTIFNNCTITNNKVVVELTSQVLAAPGIAVLEIALYESSPTPGQPESNGKCITAFPFELNVVKSAFDCENLISTDEFRVLEEVMENLPLLEQLDDLYSDVNTLKSNVDGHTIRSDVPANAVFTDTTYSQGDGISISDTTISNSGVRSVAQGSESGTVAVNTNGTVTNIKVKDWGTAATKNYTTSVSDDNANLVTSGAVKQAIDTAVSSVYKPAGDKTVAQLVSSLLVRQNLGKVYNITTSGTTTSDFVEGAGKTIQVGDNVAIVDIGTTENPVYKFDLLSGMIDMSNYQTKTMSSPIVVGSVSQTTVEGAIGAINDVCDSLNENVAEVVTTDTITLTGNYLNLTTKSAQNVQDCQIEMDVIQDLHGYNAPWVGGTRKNKLEDNVQSGTIDTFTLTKNKDGSLTINGTASSNVVLIGNFATNYLGAGAGQNDGKKHIPNGTYKISCGRQDSGSGFISLQVYGTNTSSGTSDISQISGASNASVVNMAIDNTYAYNYCRLIASAGTYNNVIVKPIIYLSTETDMTYEPWKNICPIYSYSGVDIKEIGKNILEQSMLETSGGTGITYTVGGDGSIVLNGSSTSTFFIGFQFSLCPGSYVLSGCPSGGSINTYRQDIRGNALNGTVVQNIEDTGNGYSFTLTDKLTAYFTIRIAANYSCTNLTFYPMIRLSANTDAVYEKYVSYTFPIAFGAVTPYSGTLDIRTGKLVIDKAYTTIGDLTWTYYNNSYFRTNVVGGKIVNSGQVNGTSSYYALYNGTISNFISDDKKIYICPYNISTSESYIAIIDSSYSDVNTFKTAMADVQIIYELAEPQTYYLSPHEVSLLLGVNNISVYAVNSTQNVRDDFYCRFENLVYRDGVMASLADIQDVMEHTLPPAPNGDGTYILKCVVSSGSINYSWVLEVSE